MKIEKFIKCEINKYKKEAEKCLNREIDFKELTNLRHKHKMVCNDFVYSKMLGYDEECYYLDMIEEALNEIDITYFGVFDKEGNLTGFVYL